MTDSTTAPPQYSADGKHFWDGTKWLAVPVGSHAMPEAPAASSLQSAPDPPLLLPQAGGGEEPSHRRSRRWIAAGIVGLLALSGLAVVALGRPLPFVSGSGSDGAAYGAAVQTTDPSGFNYSLAITPEVVQATVSYQGESAPPGQHYLRGSLKVTNEEADRPAVWEGPINFVRLNAAGANPDCPYMSPLGSAPAIACNYESVTVALKDPQGNEEDSAVPLNLGAGGTHTLWFELGPVSDGSADAGQLVWWCGDGCQQPVSVRK